MSTYTVLIDLLTNIMRLAEELENVSVKMNSRHTCRCTHIYIPVCTVLDMLVYAG